MTLTPGQSLDLSLNPDMEISVQTIGEERQPLLVVDRVMRRAASLVDFAAEQARFEPSAFYGTLYPGIMAPSETTYVNTLVAALRPAIEDAFDLRDAQPVSAKCNLCISTLRPEELAPEQRVPHVDTVDPMQFAILHYLCDDSFGGTGFYRHRSTGFESLSAEREPIHREALARELAAAPPPKAYVDRDMEHYAQIASVDCRFDRVVVYRSCLFHSVSIAPGAELSPDPRNGRLTANIFLNYRWGAAKFLRAARESGGRS